MDGNTVSFNEAYNVAQAIIDGYKKELKEIDAIGTGNLINSVDFEIVKEDGLIKLKLLVNDYYYFIEHGRRPTVSDGWDDPIGDLTTWIQSKIRRGKMIPRGTQKVPSTQKEVKRAAYAIYLKIRDEGYYGHDHNGKHPLKNALEEAQASGLVDAFANAFIGAYTEDLKTSLEDLQKRTIPHK